MVKLVLAPVKGYTDHLYRRVFFNFFKGIDSVVTPFLILSEDNRVKSSFFPPLFPELKLGIKVVPQFLVKKGEMLIEASKILSDMGIGEFNINMGCPSPSIYKKGRGSGLLDNLNLMNDLLNYVVPRIPGDLTVKIRTGLENSDNIDKIVNVLNNFPLKEVIVHPRFGKQLYTGVPDMDAFRYVYSNSKNPVAYNGDVNNIVDYKKIVDEFTLSSVMLGRGVLMDPFFPEYIKTGVYPDLNTRKEILKIFVLQLNYLFLEEYPNPKTAFSRMKSLLIYLAKGLDANELLVKRAQDLNQILSILDLN